MNRKPGMDLLLSSFHVLDLTDESGYFCAKILGDLGAEVTRVEKPGVAKNFWWQAYNTNKKVLELDIEKESGKVLELIRKADFLVESFAPGYLDKIGLGSDALKKVNPKLIVTSITPFGQTGPYKDYKASDIEVMAMSGFMHVLGDADRPPVRMSSAQSPVLASAEAAMATLIAHYHRTLTGEGQRVDVSAHESLFETLMHAPFYYTWAGINPMRTGKYRLGVSGAMFLHPLIWKCKEGYVAYMLQGGKGGAYSNRTIAGYIEKEGDLPDFMKGMDWDNFDLGKKTTDDMEKIWAPFYRYFARHTAQEVYDLAVRDRLQLFPVNTTKQVLEDVQLVAREFWREQTVSGKTVKVPGPFAQLSFPENGADKPLKAEKPKALPFEDLKVLDFSWVGTGPTITMRLAAYGAEVIKVESTTRVDATRVGGPFKDNKPGINRSAQFLVFNGGKKSLSLNLNSPEGRELAKKLVKWADIVFESFSPGQMDKWGLGYHDLRKINPNIIMLSTSMMGETGPNAAQPGLGLQLTSLAGFTELTGWPDRDPVFIWGAYTDVLAARLGGAVFISALDYRHRTGHGCYIDLSQYEASQLYLAPVILECQATNKIPTRTGNRSPEAAPHGAFPCKGTDQWCAISVHSDVEWRAFVKAVGSPVWGKDATFATLEKRKQNEDDLEKHVGEWTKQFTPAEVMTLLQKAGIHAAAVQSCAELFTDPQLNHRKHFIPVDHPEVGVYDYNCPGFRLEKVPLKAERVPNIGEHNEYACTKLLGMSDEEFLSVLASGALE